MKKIAFFVFVMFCFVLSGFSQQFQSLNNDEFAKLIKQKKVQIVDVRTEKEFMGGHLHKAINIDVNKTDFEAQLSLLKKKNPVAVYCRSGKRSKKAAEKMSALGYKVYELNTGIVSWPGEIEK